MLFSFSFIFLQLIPTIIFLIKILPAPAATVFKKENLQIVGFRR